MAAEYKKPKDFAEAIAQYTGKPIENTPEEPWTEEERKKMEELEKKMRGLSKEERLERMCKAIDSMDF